MQTLRYKKRVLQKESDMRHSSKIFWCKVLRDQARRRASKVEGGTCPTFFGTPGAELLCLLHMDQHGHAAVERSNLRNRPAGRLLSAVESLLQHQIGPNVWGVRNAPLHSLVARAAVGRKEGKFTTPLAANKAEWVE